jgi:hypothetical protein
MINNKIDNVRKNVKRQAMKVRCASDVFDDKLKKIEQEKAKKTKKEQEQNNAN